jgi:Zn-dependent membrane protease YugP
MFGYNPFDMVIILVSIGITLWAQMKIKSAYRRYSQMSSIRGLTGGEIARSLLSGSGIDDVSVERTAGELTDHYDPRARVLKLSDGVYGDRSIAAVGIAAHEVGHAIQHNTGFFALNFRNSLVPVANLGSSLAWPLVIIAIIFRQNFLLNIGIFLFAGVVIFHIITLPVEINASRRAVALLEGGNYLRGEELIGAKKVLTAAALTYIAAAAVAVLNLLRLLLLRRHD